jgi:hypothetical protein
MVLLAATACERGDSSDDALRDAESDIGLDTSEVQADAATDDGQDAAFEFDAETGPDAEVAEPDATVTDAMPTDGAPDAGPMQCPEGTFGPDCALCTCINGQCNSGESGDGTCSICDPGWTGANCDECSAGFFGWRCDACTCVNGTCNDGPDGDGTCSACSPGSIGPNCDACDVLHFGPLCEPCTCVNGVCDEGISGSGSCACELTWGGPNCDASASGAFRVTSLGAQNCTTVYHRYASGGDRGGLAVGRSQIFYGGGLRLTRFPKSDLRRGAGFAFPTDGLVTDLDTNTVYLLADNSGPILNQSTSPIPVTRLLEVNDGATSETDYLTGRQISISPSLSLPRNAALFSGAGRLVIHDGSRIVDINLSTGLATDRGPAQPLPIQRCGPPSTFPRPAWGVAEYFDQSLHLTFVSTSTSVVRYSVATGALTPVGVFSNLSRMCSIAISPRDQRWYFQHPDYSQFSSTPAYDPQVVGHCEATFDTPGNPPAPVFASAGEVIASATSLNPNITGTAEANTVIDLYRGPVCAGPPIASGTADVSGNVAVALSVAPNSRTELSAVARRPDGTHSLCALGPTYVHDDQPPSMPGNITATPFGSSVALGWSASIDNLARERDLAYEYCVANASGGCASFTVRGTAIGATRVSLFGLGSGTRYFAVRARDEGGNTSNASVERSVTVGGVVGSTFRVTSLAATGCQTSEHILQTWDPWGGIAAGGERLFYAGSEGAASFAVADLSDGYALGIEYDLLVSDVSTGIAYVLANGVLPKVGPGQVTGLLPIDSVTGMLGDAPITLSTPLDYRIGSGLYSGLGTIILDNFDRLYSIQIPSGVVTNLGPSPGFDRTTCGNGGNFGIAEFFNNSVHLLHARNNDIYRYTVSTGARSLFQSFTDLHSACALSFSPRLSRWYFEAAGPNQFAPPQFHVGFCDATFDQP